MLVSYFVWCIFALEVHHSIKTKFCLIFLWTMLQIVFWTFLYDYLLLLWLFFPFLLNLVQVDGVCKLINQNRVTLVSIELVYCKISYLDVNMICSSVYSKEIPSHGIHHFSIKSSIIFGSNSSSIPCGLLCFLSSGRFVSCFIW